MAVEISNIINGVKKKITKKTAQQNFPSITWLQEKMLKHQEDKKLKVIQFGNLQLKYRLPYEILHTYKELFEDEIYNFTSLTDKPFIIDCGANIGLSVLYFKSKYQHAEVVAFEPDAANCDLLKQNVALNNFTGVTINEAAVWVKDETLVFNSRGSQGSTIATSGTQTDKNLIEVKAVRLADVLVKRKVDFLKIDIEGTEIEVMADCAHSLHHVENLFVEYHGKVSETEKLTQLLKIVHDAGFKVYIKMAADMLHHPFVDKNTAGSFDVQLNIFCYR